MDNIVQPKREPALGFIFITLLIDITGFGIVIPVFPKLIEHLIHGNLSDAARYGGWLTFAYSVMQFLFAPVLGNLSDKYGRRPILLGSLLGFAIDYTFLAFAQSIWWLFVGRIIAGITGASFTTASAYIADVSTPEKRAQNFGIIGAAFGIGFIIGPVLGGVLGNIDTKLPFLAAAGLALLNAIYGFFILPESLAPENRRSFEWRRANPVGSLLQLKRYPAISGLVGSLILIYIAAHAVQSTWTFFTMEKFSWKEDMVGYSLGFVGILSGLVQGVLIRYTIPKFGQKRSIVYGLILYSIGLLLFAFASQSWMLFAILIVYCLGGIAGPALQGLISSQIPSNEQGELQGSLTSLISVTSIIGPPLMTTLFAWFTDKKAPVIFPGAPFLTGAILMLVSTILAVRSFKRPEKTA
ncbi:TCR/Tet family MFS transporter [Mucilaginibacter sp. Bleaf8]|uniref:TCR/Tet family MFS transporter n=1 Tax=Mucilaginibacter sp. Bleaf8 TaxID=2834430 RepID=UPI001BCE67F8|nr:TCR/Tet family MFS transporter [Mucilaginibacter sp. Bleaf8]MBS7562868.1 TCR/Tet family MFS transporter [Mucilaginibacter sp. Bleaf8]